MPWLSLQQSLATVKAGADPRYIGAPFPNVEVGELCVHMVLPMCGVRNCKSTQLYRSVRLRALLVGKSCVLHEQ